MGELLMATYKVKCPICNWGVIDNCRGCYERNILVCNHGNLDVPEVIELDVYGLKWEAI